MFEKSASLQVIDLCTKQLYNRLLQYKAAAALHTCRLSHLMLEQQSGSREQQKCYLSLGQWGSRVELVVKSLQRSRPSERRSIVPRGDASCTKY